MQPVHPVAPVQTECSLWTRNVELGVLATTKELGIATVVFLPLARGAFRGHFRDPATLGDKDIRFSRSRFCAGNWPKDLALIEQFDVLATRANLPLRNSRTHGC